MTPQRFDPATHGELGSSSMTRQEGTAIFKGNAARRTAWERREAIVSHPAFHMGQGAPRHDPVWGEQERESMRPIEHGPDIPHHLMRLRDQYEQSKTEGMRNALSAVPWFLNEVVSPAIFGEGKLIEDGSPRPEQIPNMAEKVIINTDGGKPLLDYWGFEGPEIENFPALLERTAAGFDEYAPAAANAGNHSRELEDEVVGLTGTVSGVNAVIADTPGHLADVNASFAVTSGERLPEVIGQMGTLEDQTLSTVDALSLLAAVPPLPTGSGGTFGGGGAHSDPTELDPVEAEKQRILNMPPPANLEDLFLAQEGLGHDISLYASPDAWWEAHKRELAKNVTGYAGGTPYAPGGMALVGEMGPELVNLPRGSQVIPNPRLGSEVTVNVNVEGSVVAERDLAQRIRQELIRTSRRTVDLGFVA